jgi:hypothetical protein
LKPYKVGSQRLSGEAVRDGMGLCEGHKGAGDSISKGSGSMVLTKAHKVLLTGTLWDVAGGA